MKLAALFIAIGVATFALRSSFILRGASTGRLRFEVLRRFVPVAALTALILPSLFSAGGEPKVWRTVALLVAAIVARKGNVLLTVIAGMIVLFTLREMASHEPVADQPTSSYLGYECKSL